MIARVYDQELAVATEHKARVSPETCTDEEIRNLAMECPQLARTITAAKVKACAPPAAPAPPAKRSDWHPVQDRIVELCERKGFEGDFYKIVQTVAEEFPQAPTPLLAFNLLYHFVEAINDKNKTRNSQIEALEARIKGLESASGETTTKGVDHTLLAQLELRLRAVEDRPAPIRFRGVWCEGSDYRKNDVCAWGGSMFIAVEDTDAKPGLATDASRAWVLAVKRGQEGRAGKDGCLHAAKGSV